MGEMTLIAAPEGQTRAAVLLLHGSSGRPEIEQAHLLAAQGAAVMVPRWFGGEGQPPGICEIPLEYFLSAVDRLRELFADAEIGAMGISKGAEASLLLAAHDARVSSVVAIAPPSVVWANVGPGSDGQTYPYRSSWSLSGKPLPFVPYDEDWRRPESGGPVAYRGQYERSLATHADRVADAAIAVEKIRGRVLLVCGGDDEVWPTALFADQIVARRKAHGLATQVVSDAYAGHRPVLPGETPRAADGRLVRGGSLAADQRLGAAAWPQILATLGLVRGRDRDGPAPEHLRGSRASRRPS